ncbi:MAG: outer membrane protein assembly factor BamD [Planctomycetota bacterium]|nr:MAG: outer membrane protein assembly factor BamD [Planctomycetota bacterium]
MKPLRSCFPVLALILATACSSPPPEPYSSADLAPVRAARDAGDWEEAWDLIEDLEREYFDRMSQGEFSRLAGDIAYEIENWDRSIRHYGEFLLFQGPTEDSRLVEQRLLEMGLDLLEGRRRAFGIFPDRGRGATILLNMAAWAPASPYASEALASVGEYHYSQEYFDEALEDYQLILRFHPNSEWADLATFRIGMCGFQQLDGPEVDGRLIDGSRSQLKQYLRTFPSGLYRQEAEEVVAELDEMSASHHLLIGEYYLEIGNLRGARQSFEEAAGRTGTDASTVALAHLESLPPDPPLEAFQPVEE